MVTFSIIVPVYNVARYLNGCLDSIAIQTYDRFECICVDDGSTDGSGEILDAYSLKDPRFKVVHRRNGGVSSARNLALKIARGTYIAFVDADDVIHKDWLDNIGQIANANSPDWIRMSWLDFQDGQDLPEAAISYDKGVQCFSGAMLRCVAYKELSGSGLMVLNVYKRCAISCVAFDENVSLREDFLFAVTALKNLATLCISKFNGYYYRRRIDAASADGCDLGRCRQFLDALYPVAKHTRDAICDPGEKDLFVRLVSWVVHKEGVFWFSRMTKGRSGVLRIIRRYYRQKLFVPSRISFRAKIAWKLTIWTGCCGLIARRSKI